MFEPSREACDLIDDASGSLAVGELDEAVAGFRKCTEKWPEWFDAWQSLAMGLYKKGEHREAIGAGLMAVSLEPNDLLAWTGLSQMYVAEGMIAEAEDAKANARILSMGGRVDKTRP